MVTGTVIGETSEVENRGGEQVWKRNGSEFGIEGLEGQNTVEEKMEMKVQESAEGGKIVKIR
jgi:hypothetical protein